MKTLSMANFWTLCSIVISMTLGSSSAFASDPVETFLGKFVGCHEIEGSTLWHGSHYKVEMGPSASYTDQNGAPLKVLKITELPGVKPYGSSSYVPLIRELIIEGAHLSYNQGTSIQFIGVVRSTAKTDYDNEVNRSAKMVVSMFVKQGQPEDSDRDCLVRAGVTEKG